MIRVSSNFTLFFKLFIPTVWIVFFTLFTGALFLADPQQLPLLTSPAFKFPFLAGYILFFGLLRYTVMPLKRLEMDSEWYYVSNYFATYRMKYEDIASVRIFPLGRLQIMVFELKAPGSFGRKLTFLASRQLFALFCKQHPDTAQQLQSLHVKK
jgi:hypothetical protein